MMVVCKEIQLLLILVYGLLPICSGYVFTYEENNGPACLKIDTAMKIEIDFTTRSGYRSTHTMFPFASSVDAPNKTGSCGWFDDTPYVTYHGFPSDNVMKELTFSFKKDYNNMALMNISLVYDATQLYNSAEKDTHVEVGLDRPITLSYYRHSYLCTFPQLYILGKDVQLATRNMRAQGYSMNDGNFSNATNVNCGPSTTTTTRRRTATTAPRTKAKTTRGAPSAPIWWNTTRPSWWYTTAKRWDSTTRRWRYTTEPRLQWNTTTPSWWQTTARRWNSTTRRWRNTTEPKWWPNSTTTGWWSISWVNSTNSLRQFPSAPNVMQRIGYFIQNIFNVNINNNVNSGQ